MLKNFDIPKNNILVVHVHVVRVQHMYLHATKRKNTKQFQHSRRTTSPTKSTSNNTPDYNTDNILIQYLMSYLIISFKAAK